MEPFAVAWDASDVAGVLRDVEACRLPAAPMDSGWSLGCDRDFLERLRRHWVDAYDWRAAVDELNAHPQFRARVQGIDVHFVLVEGEAPHRRPLLLTHGWPGSHLEFWDVIDRLAFPSRFGGNPRDAFDLVIPSLPGYAFSGRPSRPMGPRATADLWQILMTEVLGYRQYLAQGGDWGGIVTSHLGLRHADAVRGIHLNSIGIESSAAPRNHEEQAWGAQVRAARARWAGYAAVQTVKPMSLAWAMAGNPLGQASWILERFHDWADLGGHELESIFRIDRLITNVMLYVMTDSFASALWLYRGFLEEGGLAVERGTRCEVPTAYADFPGDALLVSPPRSRLDLHYNLVRMTSMPKGGHFAAMEQPALFAADVIEWGRTAWPID